jgi:hypothetical protein
LLAVLQYNHGTCVSHASRLCYFLIESYKQLVRRFAQHAVVVLLEKREHLRLADVWRVGVQVRLLDN